MASDRPVFWVPDIAVVWLSKCVHMGRFKTLGWLLVLAVKLASSFYYAVVYKLAFPKSCLIRNGQLLYMFFRGHSVIITTGFTKYVGQFPLTRCIQCLLPKPVNSVWWMSPEPYVSKDMGVIVTSRYINIRRHRSFIRWPTDRR